MKIRQTMHPWRQFQFLSLWRPLWICGSSSCKTKFHRIIKLHRIFISTHNITKIAKSEPYMMNKSCFFGCHFSLISCGSHFEFSYEFRQTFFTCYNLNTKFSQNSWWLKGCCSSNVLIYGYFKQICYHCATILVFAHNWYNNWLHIKIIVIFGFSMKFGL